MVKLHGIVEDGSIRLTEPINLPSGTEVEVTIEVGPADEEAERRQRLVRKILQRPPIRLGPLSVRDLIEDGRER